VPRAWSLIRAEPHYRRDAFDTGLRAVGFDLVPGEPVKPGPGDLLLIWNRMGSGHRAATLMERAGGIVVVAENGYLGVDPEGRHLYALALGHHNGAGRWHAGGSERWASLGLTLQPWRRDGEFILLLPQRGIGEPGVAMPKSWVRETVNQLGRVTRRRVVVRDHPGRHISPRPLEEALAGCWCAVTWGSGAGVKALVAGFPVIHGLEDWIGAPAASRDLGLVDAPPMLKRLPMLERLAWAQWTVGEIESGEAFACLLSATRQGQGP
jgi:hypothetical protein